MVEGRSTFSFIYFYQLYIRFYNSTVCLIKCPNVTSDRKKTKKCIKKKIHREKCYVFVFLQIQKYEKWPHTPPRSDNCKQ